MDNRTFARNLTEIIGMVDGFEITPPSCDGLLVELCELEPEEVGQVTDCLFASRAGEF